MQLFADFFTFTDKIFKVKFFIPYEITMRVGYHFVPGSKKRRKKEKGRVQNFFMSLSSL